MSFLPVFLWTDILIYILLAVIAVSVLYIRRKPHLRKPWRSVIQRKRGVISIMILTCFVVIGLLDSIHFRSGLETDSEQSQQHYSSEVLSVFDLTVDHLRTNTEKTYSAPFATELYVREMHTDEDGMLVYDYMPLKHAGLHLEEGENRWTDIGQRTAAGITAGLIFTLAVMALYSATSARKRQTDWQKEWSRMWGGHSEYPVRTFYFMLFLLSSTIIVLSLLSQHYHVLGTDKVGQDVLYLTLKSIRTGLVIGTLTTLVMLPLAILMGISAGYFKGWVDDVIQYIYTTLNSIPGVLLIAAAVLMLQVYINNNPENFATMAERADLRLLFLCIILGVTSWTGLCRILRGETLKLRESEYVLASRATGAGSFKILRKHILPNLMHLVMITVVLDFSGLVLAEAVLSYVGVGVDPSMISWGNMINSARLEMARDPVVWWSLTAAFIFMFTLVLAANLFADVVRDAFDPRFQGAK